jgi:hypothetical protein
VNLDPVLVLSVLLLLCLVILVGYGLGVLFGLALNGLERLQDWWAGRRKGGHLITRDDFSDLPILRHYGFTWKLWEEMTNAERASYRDTFFRSKGL